MLATAMPIRRLGMLFLVVALACTSCRLLRDPDDGRSAPVSDVQSNGSQSGAIRVYFTTPENEPNKPGNIADKLAGYIDQAKESIDVAAYELDNQIITESLLQAVDRGVRVRLVTDSDYINEHGPKTLRAAGVPVVEDKRSAIMHNKFMIIDNKAVWTGSMNFTENCAYRNNNHGIMFVDRSLVENYNTKFRWMFEDHKFGGKPSSSDKIPNPRVTLSNGVEVENYFTTHDEVVKHVVDELDQAKKSIHFLAFSFTHEKIGNAMISASKEGLDVSGVFETSQAAGQASQYPIMKAAGLKVYQDGNSRNMHHKCIIIDGSVTIAGSFNFTRSAEKSNDENLVIIRSRDVASKFEAEFRKVRDLAKPSD